MSVLIVGQPINVQNAIARLLRRNGFDVATAIDGRRALNRLRGGKNAHCVIIDVFMPDMCGGEFVRAVAAEELMPLGRILVLTVFQNVDNATAYLRFGCGSYMGKPFDNNRLLSHVRQICNGETPEFDAIL